MKSANALSHRLTFRQTVTAVTTASIAEALPGQAFPAAWRQDPGARGGGIRRYATSMRADVGNPIRFTPPATLFQSSDSTRQENYTCAGKCLDSCAVVDDALVAGGKTKPTVGPNSVVTLTGSAAKG